MTENGKKRVNGGIKNSSLFYAVFCGIIMSFAVILIVSMLLSSISLKFKNPIRFSNVLACISVLFGGLSEGIISSCFYKKSPVVSSLVSSFISSLIMVIVGLLGNKFNISMMVSPAILMTCSISVAFFFKGKSKNNRIKKYLNV